MLDSILTLLKSIEGYVFSKKVVRNRDQIKKARQKITNNKGSQKTRVFKKKEELAKRKKKFAIEKIPQRYSMKFGFLMSDIQT